MSNAASAGLFVAVSLIEIVAAVLIVRGYSGGVKGGKTPEPGPPRPKLFRGASPCLGRNR